MLVVADTSPLIYLSRVGVLDVLPATFGTVVVPQMVWDELVLARPSAPGVDLLTAATWIRVTAEPLPIVDLGLDPGETAAILLAEKLGADILLIDERAGRVVAETRGLVVRGTLGVLVRARESGHLPALKPVIEALQAEGFRIAPALVHEALRRVGEAPFTGK